MRNLAVASCLILALAACDDRPKMTVEPNPVVSNTTVWARFDRPISGSAVDQYWIVIAPVGAPAAYRVDWSIVARGAAGAQLTAPSVGGDYEVRLHGDWPKRESNIVRTVPLRVLPGADVIGSQ